jgi:hypothetical protein
MFVNLKQKYIIEKIRCYSNEFPKIFDVDACSSNKEISFIWDFLNSDNQSVILNDNCGKLCPQECDSVDYDISVSFDTCLF